MSKNKLGEDLPSSKFIHLKIRRHQMVKKCVIGHCISIYFNWFSCDLENRILWYGHTCDSQLKCHLGIIQGHWDPNGQDMHSGSLYPHNSNPFYPHSLMDFHATRKKEYFDTGTHFGHSHQTKLPIFSMKTNLWHHFFHCAMQTDIDL